MKWIIAALFILHSMLLCGCLITEKPFLHPINIDARVTFNLAVPYNQDSSIQLNWYRITSIDTDLNELENSQGFVGNQVKLHGEHVNQLNGASVTITKQKLSELVNETFYRTILLEEKYIYGVNQNDSANQAYSNPSVSELKTVKKILSEYVKDCYVLNFNFSYSGRISENIRIEGIEIEQIDYACQFNQFNIISTHLPAFSTKKLEDVFEASNLGGTLLGPSLSNCGFYFVEGKAKQRIKEIKCISLTDVCQIIGKDNYQEYEKMCESKFNVKQKLTDFVDGEMINIEFDYVFDNFDNTKFKTFDVSIASLATVFVLPDNQQVYSFLYQTSMRSPEYSLVHVLHSLR
ncbi:MAG TPA: hypothetical protein DCM45_01765 [Clostridiales bacterium]|nr:hypothetical protein [Clostridiales bacterium]